MIRKTVNLRPNSPSRLLIAGVASSTSGRQIKGRFPLSLSLSNFYPRKLTSPAIPLSLLNPLEKKAARGAMKKFGVVGQGLKGVDDCTAQVVFTRPM